MRLIVDLNRCRYAQCVFLAPDVFELRGAEALRDPNPDDAERLQVLRAAAACPVQASWWSSWTRRRREERHDHRLDSHRLVSAALEEFKAAAGSSSSASLAGLRPPRPCARRASGGI